MRAIALLSGITAALVVAGCPGGGAPPSVTIGDVPCRRDQVSISADVTANRVQPPPGSVYEVNVTVTVKCGDTGVEGAQISASYWWGTVASATTDANGVATFAQQSSNGAVPSDAKVDVTVTPTEGDPFVESVTPTVNN